MGRNLMAVRTQQTGVNPETEVVRSHMLTFGGVNTRSNSGNVFWRFGRGANLRDMLNRRHD